MNIIVCVKQVPDPEAPTAQFRIDEATKRLRPSKSVNLVANPFDMNAVEAAIQLKEAVGGKITVLSLGPESSSDVLKQAVAMGADEAVRIDSQAGESWDSFLTAHALAAAVRKVGQFDLILCGRQAADTNAGQMGVGLATALGISCVSFASRVEPRNGKIEVERIADKGREVFEVALPALLTVSNEMNHPRFPTAMKLIAAGRQQIPSWSLAEIGFDAGQLSGQWAGIEETEHFIPRPTTTCEFVEGETLEEAGEKLALRLRAEKVL
ncbi:MAG: electron transfer flavoprotein subunit beta/FixA family protein [Candidatus Eiseniibacteriota bacterium]|nr:MAG: electron transfer flavoprotein subunit beta/FixA family protein [Candidatus Eisenbacteria bacterium]